MILPEDLQGADQRGQYAADPGGGREVPRLVRLSREQQSGKTYNAAHGCRGIGKAPADHGGRRKDRHVAEEVAGAQAEDIGRGHQVLFFIPGALDAPSIDGDVLRRGGKGGEHGEGDEHAQSPGWSRKRHAEDAEGDEGLAEQHPGAAMAEAPADPGQLDPVHERGPEKLGGDEDADPAHEADGAERDAFRAEPETQRHSDQNRRHAGGDSENHGQRDLGLVQRGQNLPHAGARALRLVLAGDDVGHSSSGAARDPASPLGGGAATGRTANHARVPADFRLGKRNRRVRAR